MEKESSLFFPEGSDAVYAASLTPRCVTDTPMEGDEYPAVYSLPARHNLCVVNGILL